MSIHYEPDPDELRQAQLQAAGLCPRSGDYVQPHQDEHLTIGYGVEPGTTSSGWARCSECGAEVRTETPSGAAVRFPDHKPGFKVGGPRPGPASIPEAHARWSRHQTARDARGNDVHRPVPQPRWRTRRRYLALALGIVVLLTLALVYAFTDDAAAGELPDCEVTERHIGPGGKRATFRVTGGPCVLSLVSYERRGSGSLADQVLHDSASATLAAGRHELVVTVPDCPWQVDLVRGPPRPAADYINRPGDVLAYRFGGEGTCSSTTTTSVSTTSTTTAPTTTTTPAPTSPSTTVTPTTAPSVPSGGSSPPPSPFDRGELPQSGGPLVPLAAGALILVALGTLAEWRGRARG